MGLNGKYRRVTSSNSFQNPYNPFPPNIKEVTFTFAWNIACPYMGVFFINEGRTREKRDQNERRTRKDFSQNCPFRAF